MLPRDDDGRLSAYAWPGGYPYYYVDDDNSVLCVNCARSSDEDPDEIPQFKPTGAGINCENELWCDDCGERIQSAY